MFFNTYEIVYLLHNKISVFTHDFQHTRKELSNSIQPEPCWKSCWRNVKIMKMEIKYQIDVDWHLARGE